MTGYVETSYDSSGNVFVDTVTYDYNAESSPGSGVYTGAYQGGVVTHMHDFQEENNKSSKTLTTDWNYSYVWWDGALQSYIHFHSVTDGGTVKDWHTDINYDASGYIHDASIQDGDPRDTDIE